MPEKAISLPTPGVKQRDVIRMSADEIDRYLSGRHTLAAATFDPHGSVHLVAMWYGFIGGLIALETKTKSQKVKNLRCDPRITVMVESGDSYDQLRGVEIVGMAEIRDDRDSMLELGRSVISRYTPPAEPDHLDPMVEHMIRNRVAIVIHPQRVVSWDHSKLSSSGRSRP